MPASNYYDDGPSDGGMNDAQPSMEKESDEMDGEETTIIPKSVTGGKDFQVGDEIVLEVVAIHEDSLEVRYASDKGSDDKEPGMDDKEPSMARATATNSDSSSYMD